MSPKPEHRSETQALSPLELHVAAMPLEDRLAATIRPGLEFERSFAAACEMTDEEKAIPALAEIGRALARLNVLSKPLPGCHVSYSDVINKLRTYVVEEITGDAETRRKLSKQSDRARLAMADIYEDVGDFDTSSEMLGSLTHYTYPGVDRMIQTVTAKHQHGQDPLVDLEAAFVIANFERRPLSADMFEELEKVLAAYQQVTGETPLEIIPILIDRIKDHSVRFTTDEDVQEINNWYATISRIYATAGQFDQAFDVVDKMLIQGSDAAWLDSMHCMIHMAEEQIKKGKYREATVSAHTALNCVIGGADEDPDHRIEHEFFQVKIHAIWAEANTLEGNKERADISFNVCQRELKELEPYWRAEALMVVARTQSRIGQEATVTLGGCRMVLDKMTGRRNDGSVVKQKLGYEHLIKLQAELFQIGAAKETLAALERVQRSRGSLSDEALLTSLRIFIAEKEAMLGLSTAELTSLVIRHDSPPTVPSIWSR